MGKKTVTLIAAPGKAWQPDNGIGFVLPCPMIYLLYGRVSLT